MSQSPARRGWDRRASNRRSGFAVAERPASLREYTTIDEALGIEAWEELTAPPPSHCGSRGWFAAAFEHVHPDAEPLVLTAEEDGHLIALLPLAVHRRAGTVIVRFAGAPYADINDVLARPGRDGDAVRAALNHLTRLRDRGWRIALDDLDPDGVLARRARVPAPLLSVRSSDAPIVDLSDPDADPISRRRRKEWNRLLRRLLENHEFSLTRDEGAAVVAEFGRFCTLRTKALRAAGRPLADPPLPFVKAVVSALPSSCRSALMTLAVDGRPVAQDLYVLNDRHAMLWLRALDPSWRRYACGHQLLRFTITALTSEGFETLNFGRGAEQYKYVFGGRTRTLAAARLPASLQPPRGNAEGT